MSGNVHLRFNQPLSALQQSPQLHSAIPFTYSSPAAPTSPTWIRAPMIEPTSSNAMDTSVKILRDQRSMLVSRLRHVVSLTRQHWQPHLNGMPPIACARLS